MKNTRNDHPRRILVALRLAYSSHAGFLSGVARYLKRKPDWRVTVSENFSDFDSASLSAIEAAGFDGIITVRPRTREAEAAIEQSSLPVAILGTGSGDCRKRKHNVVFIRGNDRSIGVIAARHFIKLGNFRSYAFVGTENNVAWATDRKIGLLSELTRRKIKLEVIPSPFPNGSQDDINYLAERLKSLPLPAAIFAAYDNRARNVLLACDAANLNVPHQIAVMGVDNDTSLCDFCYPSLTSIATNPAEKGERASIELEKIISKNSSSAKTIFVPGANVVERESTAPLAPSSHLVERALSFIANKALTGIKPRDVASYLGVSRALADRRFRECNAGTIGNAIAKVQIAKIKELLIDKKMPIAKITFICGLPDENYAKRLFKKHTGMTMREWRRQNQS